MAEFNNRKPYRGPLRGVILDWAGTTVDYGCMAPVTVFIEIFKARGIGVSMAEARGPMGAFKRDHIAQVLALPTVAQQWSDQHGHLPTDADVQALYESFTPRQVETIVSYATLIPGVIPTIAAMRERGLKIGSCTGYTQAMMQPLLPVVKQQGYAPDAVVYPDDLGGRPAPWMCFENARQLGIYPLSALVKIGDTVMDVEEGLNAGMWTIGLSKTGNEVGLTQADFEALPQAEQTQRLLAAHAHLADAGAHYVVESIADVLPVLDQIDARMRLGEHP